MMHQFDVWNICLLERRWILSNRGSVLIHNYQTLLFFGEKRDCFSREGSTTFCAYWTSNQGDHDLLICVSQAIAHKREVNSRKKNNKACPISGNSTNNFSLKTYFKTKKLCITSSPTISFFFRKLFIPGIGAAGKGLRVSGWRSMYTGKLYNYSFRETFLQDTRLGEGHEIFISSLYIKLLPVVLWIK